MRGHVGISTYTSVDVDVPIEDLLGQLSESERRELAHQLVPGLPNIGDGDADLLRNTVMRAEMAARRMADLPREIADLFWHVHGVAL